MPRRSDTLARVRVRAPCTADWDSMVGNDQVRFCGHCNLNVHNLSAMTRADARRLVRRMRGDLCVRYYHAPDGSPHTLPPPTRLHQIARRASRLAAGTVGAVLTLGAGALAQSGNARPPADAPQAVAGFVVRAGASLTGKVFDPAGAVIPNAVVLAVRGDASQPHGTTTDAEGVYRFKSLPPGRYTLTAIADGFVTGEVRDIEVAEGAVRTQDATLEVRGPREKSEVTRRFLTVTMGDAMIVTPKDPLVKAAFDDDLKAVEELLALGVDANVFDRGTQTTALVEAVENGNVEVVCALLGAGADVNLRDKTRRTPLMSLDGDASADLARELLAAGARVNVSDDEGNTPLTGAAAYAKEEVLRVLLEAGAKVNAGNKRGRTALMMAAENGVLENVRALLHAGADVGRKDEDGATALSLARAAEHEEVAVLLLAFGAVKE